jgi:hypothetical protein
MARSRFDGPSLFAPVLPDGFLYQSDFLSDTEEADLMATIETRSLGRTSFVGTLRNGGLWLTEEVTNLAIGAWPLPRI